MAGVDFNSFTDEEIENYFNVLKNMEIKKVTNELYNTTQLKWAIYAINAKYDREKKRIRDQRKNQIVASKVCR